MYDDSLSFNSPADNAIQNATQSKPTITTMIRFDGYNADITESYYWFYNFAYYTGKGYTTVKLEDYHYFSETSQFGAQMRQIKGGSIRAFQENLNQLIQLIKVHLFPLLKEVKQSDFYYRWINQITIQDEIVQKLISSGKGQSPEAQKARKERNEAIAHLKDKWTTEVDGGRLWQMQRSATEQGLDFSLLPQMFLGTSIDDPLATKKSIKEQLDESIYQIQTTKDAKEAAARMHYRFYTWLPSAIKDTQVTFKIKIATLKQFYSQVQMQINFMKPLLLEINKKSEGFHFDSLYHNFESENPDFAMLLDTSYMYVKTLGIKGFERGGLKFDVLQFGQHGLFIPANYGGKKEFIIQGPCKGKSGFITTEKKGQYDFYETNNKNISYEDFKKLKKQTISKEDLAKFSCIQLEFKQTRKTETKVVQQQGQQIPQPIPFMLNTVLFNGYAWNLFEISSYRHKIKNQNLELLESFIEELKEIKNDLLYYANYFEGKDKQENKENNKSDNKTEKEEIDTTLFLGPFKGIYELFKPLTSSFKFDNKEDEPAPTSGENHASHKTIKLNSIDDTWKLYSIYKKTHGHMMY